MSDKRDHAIRLLLENAFNDIRYTKQQQWRVLYLTLSAIVVITYLATNKYCPFEYFWIVLLVGDLFIGILGIVFLFKYMEDLKKYRNHKETYIKQLKIKKLNTNNINNTCCFTTCFSVVIMFFMILCACIIVLRILNDTTCLQFMT